MLCERGIRTFESYTRNTLDLSAIPVLQSLSHLPVISDPSHGTGRRELVEPMTKASVAAGANGLIIEMHTDPDNSMTGDGVQSLFPDHSPTCCRIWRNSLQSWAKRLIQPNNLPSFSRQEWASNLIVSQNTIGHFPHFILENEGGDVRFFISSRH